MKKGNLPALKLLPDRDGSKTIKYDALGRVIRRKILIDNRPYAGTNYNKVWRTTLYGYDDLDRIVKVITNAVNEAYFDDPDAQADLGDYSSTSGADVDLITQPLMMKTDG